MASTSTPSLSIPLTLTNKNYQTWASKMQSFLHYEERWDLIEFGFIEHDLVSLQAMTNDERKPL